MPNGHLWSQGSSGGVLVLGVGGAHCPPPQGGQSDPAVTRPRALRPLGGAGLPLCGGAGGRRPRLARDQLWARPLATLATGDAGGAVPCPGRSTDADASVGSHVICDLGESCAGFSTRSGGYEYSSLRFFVVFGFGEIRVFCVLFFAGPCRVPLLHQVIPNPAQRRTSTSPPHPRTSRIGTANGRPGPSRTSPTPGAPRSATRCRPSAGPRDGRTGGGASRRACCTSTGSSCRPLRGRSPQCWRCGAASGQTPGTGTWWP